MKKRHKLLQQNGECCYSANGYGAEKVIQGALLDEVNGLAPEWFLKINMGCFLNLLKYCIFVEAISNVSNKRF